MVRPKKQRHIQGTAAVTYFKPAGIPLRDIEEIELTHDQWEALRLVDALNTAHKEAASIMNISPATLSRVLGAGRKAVATGITQGKALRINGGDYKVVESKGRGTGPCGGGQGNRHGKNSNCGKGGNHKRGKGCRIGKNSKAGIARAPSQTQIKNLAGHINMQTIKNVAISTAATDIHGKIEPRFGRSPGFVIVDITDMSTKYIDNTQADNMSQGAGIATADKIAKEGVSLVLTGRVGPKAAAALDAANIPYIENCGNMNIAEAIEMHCNVKTD